MNAEDWADAALDAVAEGGLEALAVERLARTLGVTKGSFYWHFENRNALLKVALERWERQQTEDVIARAEVEQDARARIDRLFRGADGSKRAGQLYLAFAVASKDPLVGSVVKRVNERRIRFMVANYTAMGLSAEDARQRAVLAYSVYLGTLQLRRDAPELIPTGPEFHAYMDYISEVLIPGFEARHRASAGPLLAD
ncbi:TetR/AcrR family transcriptional regulator [Natronocella acetinitrilica]|uniref:TetR/AcrR family transcriptional regulator n=1 Tax=Natronocella acetinitrilica TaxID=414046 RepID=UPI0020A0E3F1|nr:TetR/AcrR family transcriptional regulator [Natronocella acetinitrilica]